MLFCFQRVVGGSVDFVIVGAGVVGIWALGGRSRFFQRVVGGSRDFVLLGRGGRRVVVGGARECSRWPPRRAAGALAGKVGLRLRTLFSDYLHSTSGSQGIYGHTAVSHCNYWR